MHARYPNYRSDIDGLRALAVLAVVAFHAFPGHLIGGFIGVDVFFVISGFLISTIIFENLERGTFSFSEFYARRIKRIFPSLILVLVSCLILGWFSLLAHEYKQLGKHVFASAGFISNIILWSEAGYFDNAADTKPLLNLWSLGIEEQFYIAWPLLAWFAWRQKFNLLALSTVIAVASFWLNIKEIRQDSVAAFYSPLTRFWELSTGSLLAWFSIYKEDEFVNFKGKLDALLVFIIYREQQKIEGRIITNVFSFAGLFLLLFGFWVINKELSFPGTWALVPVVGTLLLLIGGSKAWINRKLLSSKVAVWFGLISFPLYLWHWPLLSFARIFESEVPTSNLRLAVVALSVGLAWLTYELVEKPIRFGIHSQSIVVMLIVLMLVVGLIGYNSYFRDGYKFRSAEKATKINRFDWPYRESCEKITGKFYFDDWCNSGTKEKSTFSTVVIGDSFSNAYSPMFISYSANYDDKFSFIQFGRGECPSLLNFGPDYCKLIATKAYDFIKNSSDVKTVILASQWPSYYHDKDYFVLVKHSETKASFTYAFENTIKAYKDLDKNVVILLATPFGSEPKSCILRPIRLTDKNACNLPASKAQLNDGDYRGYVIPFLNAAGIKYFDPFKYLCNEVECKIIENNKIFMADDKHISIYGGEFLAASGALELKKLLSH